MVTIKFTETIEREREVTADDLRSLVDALNAAQSARFDFLVNAARGEGREDVLEHGVVVDRQEGPLSRASRAVCDLLDEAKKVVTSLLPYNDWEREITGSDPVCGGHGSEQRFIHRMATWLFDVLGSHPESGRGFSDFSWTKDEEEAATAASDKIYAVLGDGNAEIGDRIIEAYKKGDHDT